MWLTCSSTSREVLKLLPHVAYLLFPALGSLEAALTSGLPVLAPAQSSLEAAATGDRLEGRMRGDEFQRLTAHRLPQVHARHLIGCLGFGGLC